MSDDFFADVAKRSERRNRKWYKDNLGQVLEAAKEKRVREIDVSIALADQLMKVLDEKVPVPKPAVIREVEPYKDDSLMKPINPKLVKQFYKSTEKGAAERYLHERYKILPEDRFFFRVCTSWDYGWLQKESQVAARDMNRGRCAILRDTFYRKNNLTPDPPHYAHPVGGQTSICSEYSCNFN